MSGPPTQIGPYSVESELGRGGMGVVYLATDSRLGRQVAIKALPEHFAEQPDRLARFEREARLLASLHHPNVASIHGVEEHEGHRYLVLEFVEGQTLADLLDRGPLPIDDALDIATQIAAGLEAAHDSGVIHRDLKPANIRITPDGEAKVLDFGLARSEETSSSGSSFSEAATLTTPHSPTTPGMIVGTAPYMSPEQARGRKVDKRSDIWSFGVVLYEMLTGMSPFIGETATDSIGAILHKDVDLHRLPPDVPAGVRRVLARCLVRDRADRWRDIGDVRLDLMAARHAPDEQTGAPGARRRWVAGALVIAALALGGAGLVAGRTLAPSQVKTAGVQRMSILLPEGMGTWAPPVPAIAISPDGSAIALNAFERGLRDGIYLRRLGDREVQFLAGTEEAWCQAFSPDGRWIVFVKDGKIMRVSVDGGPVQPIYTPPEWNGDDACTGLAVTNDGRVIYGDFDTRSLSEVSLSGGDARLLLSAEDDDSSIIFAHPKALPNGVILFTRRSIASSRVEEIRALVPGETESRLIVSNATSPLYSASGHLLFRRSDVVMAAPFNIRNLALEREPVPLAARPWIADVSGGLQAAVSDNGVFCFVPRPSAGQQEFQLTVLNDTGVRSPLSDRRMAIDQVALTPDGRRAAVSLFAGDGSSRMTAIWIFEFSRDLLSLLSSEPGVHFDPVFSRDGRWVYYVTFDLNDDRRFHIVRRRADGAGDAERLYSDSRNLRIMAPLDGGDRLLVITRSDASGPQSTAQDIMIIDLTGDQPAVEPWLATRANESDAEPSPDEHWVAYTSDVSGRQEVYIRPLDGDGPRVQISTDGGYNPEWAPDGSGVHFMHEQSDGELQFMFAPVSFATEGVDSESAGSPRVSAAVQWFTVDSAARGDYELLPDGRVVFALPTETAKSGEMSRIEVDLNWLDALEQPNSRN